MKVHLFISSRPMRSGETVAARCGDLVAKSKVVYAWDNVPVNAKIDWPVGIGICGKCIKAADKKHEGPMFVYAIQSR